MPGRDKTADSARGLAEANHLFDVIIDRMQEQHAQLDIDRMRQSYELAYSAHEGVERRDGSPYITHPLEVAEICVELEMDEDSIVAALLHDTIEDTNVRLNQIRQLFGKEVADMVEALTKIKRINFFARFTGRNKASTQARNLQKLFVAMTRDLRVIAIKLADRLHNMRTMGAMPEQKRKRISRETIEFYVPIARRLGLGVMVRELEDLVFEHLYPEEFHQLEQELAPTYATAQPHVEAVIETTQKLLTDHGISIRKIYSRRKHLWSVYEKMRRQGVDQDGIYDLHAVRIVLDGDELACYKALGLIHGDYKPLFFRFRDYVASPKENGYRTLHTTVVGPGATRVEFQIRTVGMDNEADKGVAAHWAYKEVGQSHASQIKDEKWEEFIEELSEEQVDSEEFVAKTRDTLLGDQVLVLSPKGEVVNLPAGSTPIDFAYYIHTDLGHATRRARVNGHAVGLDYRLKNGDSVEVFKSNEQGAEPLPEWLLSVGSPKTILKIRRFLRSKPHAERITIGRNLLRQHIVREGLQPLNLTTNEILTALLKRLPTRNIDELYERVALGYYSCEEIVDQLKEIHRNRLAGIKAPSGESLPFREGAVVGIGSTIGVQMAAGQPLRHKSELMRCCRPVPGDKLYGIYDRKDRRVRIHRRGCGALEESLASGDLVELAWLDDLGDKRYPTRILLKSINRVGLLFEVLRYLSSQHINLGGAEFSHTPSALAQDSSVRFELTLEVTGIEALEGVLTELQKIKDVFSVERMIKLKYAGLEEQD